MAKTNDGVAAELQNGLSELKTERFASLDQTLELHAAFQSLLVNEAQRIQTKFGGQHDRAKQIMNGVQANIEISRQLEIEKQLARIEVPDVPADGALVYGRVIDEDRLGIDRLVVYLADRSTARLRVSEQTTDESGFFAIQMDADAISRVSKASPEGVFVVVATPRGRLIYRQSNPVTLTKGASLRVNISLNRTDLNATPSPDPTIEVPALVGNTKQEAAAALKKVGLQLGEIRKTVAPDQAGRVVAQDPAAGSRVAPKSSVTVTVAVTEADTG